MKRSLCYIMCGRAVLGDEILFSGMAKKYVESDSEVDDLEVSLHDLSLEGK